MKTKPNRFLAASLASIAALSSVSWGATDRIKQNNTTALNNAGSWDTLPTASDVAVFNSVYATTGVLNTGGLVQWSGVRVADPGGNVIINNSSSGQNVGLGSSGIDLSAATVNLNIQRLQMDAGQTWNVASGRTFSLGSSTSVRAGAFVNNSAGATITKTGAGVVNLDTANASLGNVNWDIQGGVVRAIWNTTNAWGTGGITLGGGGIAVGTPFTGSTGNWTWNNNITLTSSTSSFIDNQNISGADRWLKLEGVISGAGNLEFRDTGSGFTNLDAGFILTGTNTNTGTVTIASGAEVRIGGANAGTLDDYAGNNGKLADDAALVTNNGTLTFARQDSHTVANAISGSGNVRIGTVSLLGGTSTSPQVVTLPGTNTYTGTTTVNNGRLNLTGSLTSDVTVANNARIAGNGSTTGLLTLNTGAGLVLAGGATTTGLTTNGVILDGPVTVTFDNSAVADNVYDVFKYGTGTVTGNPATLMTVAWRGSLSDDTINKKWVFTAGAAGNRTWNTTDGGWEQGVDANFAEGDNLFYGGDTVFFNNPAADSTVTLWGILIPAALTVDNTNSYTFSGSGYLSGTMSLTKLGTGTLTINTANTFTGNVAINGGTVKVGNPTALGTPQVGKPVSQVVIGSGGALDLNGVASIYGFTISGTGVGGTGAITNSGAAIGNGSAQVSNLKLGANASIGGSGNWALLTNSYGATSLDLAGFTLTKSGANTIALANTTITAGTVQVAGGTLSLGVAENANGVNGSTSAFILDNTAGASLSVVRNSSVGSISGGGATGGNIVLGETLTVGALNTPTTYAGVISGTGGLTKAGTSSLTLSNANTYTGTTTVNNGTLAVTTNTSLGRGLSNSSGETAAVIDFGANTLTVGNATAGNTGAFFYGQLAGTGTLQLRGGTQTIQNPDGTGSTSGNFQILLPVTSAMPTGAFALDTGASLTDRKDFGFANDTNNVLTLSSLAGYGAVRTDAGGSAGTTVTRHITVNQSSGDTVFNGALLSHRSSANAVRALTFEKTGSSKLELAGFIGKETASAAVGAAPVNLIANGGVLSVTNAANSTTANTDAINLGTITVTSGTLAFSNQALINTAGSAGATSIAMNGGTLKWNTGNTQDITAGNRLALVDGKIATFDTNSNDVTLSNALGGGAIAAAVTKEGSGKLTLGGANTYIGDTVVNGGTLAVNGSSIADTNKLVINGGKVEPTGTETVNTLYFGGVQQVSGTWGSTSSSATHKDDTRFSGTEVLQVITGPTSASDYDSWAGASGYNLTGGPGDDDDGDGLSNFEEYAFGLNPTSGASVSPVTAPNKTAGTFTYTRRKQSLTELGYTYESSTTLGGWGAFTPSAPDATDSGDPVETITVTIPASLLAEPKLFLRVKAVQPAP